LSWNERNIQVKINKWVKEQKGKGLEVKIGVGRIRIKGVWRSWTDIEKEGVGGEREEDKKGKDEEAASGRSQEKRRERIFKEKPKWGKKEAEAEEKGWDRERR